MIILGIILMLILFGGLGFATYHIIKKTDPNNYDKTVLDDIKSAQEFLPFEDIKDGMIILGGHKYRAVIECSSTNYQLKTDKEKEIIEISFQKFINSITFPITFFIQTKVIDNSKMMESLKSELNETLIQYPHLQEYANVYYDEMMNLHSSIGNNKQKKKYILIPYEEAVSLGNLSDEEKYDYSVKELYNRCNVISDGLSAVGVKTKILNTKEVAELVYSSYHKDNYSYIENILEGEGISLLVQGEENKLNNLSSDAKLDWILYEAGTRLQSEMLTESTPDFVKKSAYKCLEEIEQLRESFAGYYSNKEQGEKTLSMSDALKQNKNK